MGIAWSSGCSGTLLSVVGLGLGGAVWSMGLDSMIPVGPLQLRIFLDSMKQKYPHFVVQSDKELQILENGKIALQYSQETITQEWSKG